MTRTSIRTALLAAILGFFAIGGLAVSDAISPLGEPMVDTVGNVLLKAGIKRQIARRRRSEDGIETSLQGTTLGGNGRSGKGLDITRQGEGLGQPKFEA